MLPDRSILAFRRNRADTNAAAGHTARQIGQQLYIGERTVEGHLARTYAKLGVGSKVKLASRAAEVGLTGER